MTYRVFHGDAFAMSRPHPHLDERVQVEQFSTEHEALTRARELLDTDDSRAVAVSDGSGHLVGGVRLQLKLGYSSL